MINHLKFNVHVGHGYDPKPISEEEMIQRLSDDFCGRKITPAVIDEIQRRVDSWFSVPSYRVTVEDDNHVVITPLKKGE